MNGRRRLRRVVPMAAAFVVASSAAMLVAAGTTPADGAPSGAPQSRTALPSPLDPGIWKAKAPSGIARQEVSYTRVGGAFYLAWGGNLMQVYRPKTDAWKALSDLPTSLNHIQGVALGGLIYYLGGLTLTHPPVSVGSVYIYDPATDSVATGASMPAGRERGAGGVAVYGGKIYYAGGWHNGTSVDWFDVYDPATDAWTTLPPIPHARDHAYAAVVGSRMYMIGGRLNGTPIPQNDAYDFTTGTWVTGLAPIPTLRAGYAIAPIGSEIFVIGGEAPNVVLGTVEAYDTVHDTWRTLASMPTPRHGIQAVLWKGGIYLAAGSAAPGGKLASDAHEVLFPTSTRPDVAIRLEGDASFLGADTYDPAPGPTRSTSSTVGQPVIFDVTVQNDASVGDRILVTGPGGSPSFDVLYRLDGVDVTAAVTGSGLRLAKLAPGRSVTITLEIDPTASASSGSWTIACSSRRIPAIDDHVTAAVSVP